MMRTVTNGTKIYSFVVIVNDKPLPRTNPVKKIRNFIVPLLDEKKWNDLF
jgi:hypothetical protein